MIYYKFYSKANCLSLTVGSIVTIIHSGNKGIIIKLSASGVNTLCKYGISILYQREIRIYTIGRRDPIGVKSGDKMILYDATSILESRCEECMYYKSWFNKFRCINEQINN